MTQLFALDLSGDRAALHLWTGAVWEPQGTAAEGIGEADLPHALAELLSPAKNAPVVVVLPEEQIVRKVIDRTTPPAPHQTDTRCDWHDDTHGRHIAMVGAQVLDEVEEFLAALGTHPVGCLGAAEHGNMAHAPWFGLRSSPTVDGRASDRPAALGGAPQKPQDADVMAAARDKAMVIARRDPAYLAPLPDHEETDAPESARGKRLPAVGRKAVAAGVMVLALAVGAWYSMTGTARGPIAIDAPILSAQSPSADTIVTTLALPSAPKRHAVPTMAGRAADPMQTASLRDTSPELSSMDAPTGMNEIATFFTPPPLLAQGADVSDDDELILPGIDLSFRTDALALADISTPPAAANAAGSLTQPGPPEQVYVVDENGLIRPSPEGRLSPDGFLVVAGSPPAQTRPRPERVEPETVTVLRRADLPEDDPLRRLEPRLRPERLLERFERDRLGGKTETELASLPPSQRPASAQEEDSAQIAQATAFAVPVGPRPTARSAQKLAAFKAAAARTPVQAIASTEVTTPRAASPKAARERATTNGKLNLAEVNLLGTFGTSRNPRALVRLPSGRVINVEVGDRVDGGRVAGITDGRLSYVKSGRTLTLSMPRG
ncbi:hypothetical protein G5B39_08665 [Rhodobacteraceae bacterium SC52]|nr:hypothetical protein G5B39_08665 [Rhodobacteraceae bacterium SC52]